MKKVILLFTVLVLIVVTACGCVQQPEDDYDYKDAYERLSKTVMEQGYVLDSITGEGGVTLENGGICVCLGDTLTAKHTNNVSFVNITAEKTGLQMINCAFQETRMSGHSEPDYDAFSLCSLVDAITEGEWERQDEAADNLTWDNVSSRLETLKAVDWSAVDAVTLFYGAYDLAAGVSLDNTTDPMDIDTVSGALRYSIDKLQSAYPHIKVIVLTPVYRYWHDEAQDSDSYALGDYTYAEGIGAIIEVAKEYKIPAIDLYNTLGINSATYEYYLKSDGFMLSEKGHELVGTKLAHALIY